MQVLEKHSYLESANLSKHINQNFAHLMGDFYEIQSKFLSTIYKKYKTIESANILLCFAKNTHLQILRKKENNLDFDLSLKNFWENYKNSNKSLNNMSSIVNNTGIPKETVRRKIKVLLNLEFLSNSINSKGYYWNLSNKNKDEYFKITNEKILSLSKYISRVATTLSLNLSNQVIQNEMKNNFCFYWYHFLSFELNWLHMWHKKTKDNELLLIILQVILPAMKRTQQKTANINLDYMYKNDGKINLHGEVAINATSISDVTGIPRATCIRKLDKLLKLGFLTREAKTKKYCLKQDFFHKTGNVFTKDSVDTTIKSFSNFLSIVLKGAILKKK